MKPKASLPIFLSMSGCALLAVSSVNATQFWDGTGGDANWNTPENWGGDVIPAFGTTAINFGSLSSAAGTAFGNVTVPSQTTTNNNLTAGTLIKSINFGNTGVANRTDAYTLQGNSIVLGDAINNGIVTTALSGSAIVSSIEDVIELNMDLGTAGTHRAIQTGAKHDLRIDGVISGAAAVGVLFRSTDSKITLTNANNSYLGFTNVAEGTGSTAGGVLEITSIANGGSNSSIGASSNAATNLRFNSGFNDTTLVTLRYIGATDASTDRLFSLYGNIAGTNSMIESSGAGTLSFTNTGAIVTGHARGRNFYLGGTNTGNNTFALSLSDFNVTELSTFTKQGVGKWIITNTHSYTGATTVSEGTLVVNGSISSSILTTVASGATIAGSGTIGALTVSSGGFINPGTNPDVLDVAGAYTQAGTYNADITANTVGNGTTGYDQINVTGAVDITGGSLVAAFSNGGYALNNLIFILLNDGTDAITGTYAGYADGATVTSYGGVNWNISYSANSGTNSFTGGNDIALMAVAIPEPKAALLGALGVLLLLRRRRG